MRELLFQPLVPILKAPKFDWERWGELWDNAVRSENEEVKRLSYQQVKVLVVNFDDRPARKPQNTFSSMPFTQLTPYVADYVQAFLDQLVITGLHGTFGFIMAEPPAPVGDHKHVRDDGVIGMQPSMSYWMSENHLAPPVYMQDDSGIAPVKRYCEWPLHLRDNNNFFAIRGPVAHGVDKHTDRTIYVVPEAFEYDRDWYENWIDLSNILLPEFAMWSFA